MEISRATMAQEICARLDARRDELIAQWQSCEPINHFVLDDVLPEEWALDIHRAFPPSESMVLKKSLRELKFVAAQMNKYQPVLEEVIYAFQASGVVDRVHRITGLRALEPDELLYAGGISMMALGHFLNPHLDNSHDKFRKRYRVLNLLYYVSPGWSLEQGGNLELWQEGPKGKPTTLVSKFNRLVVMVTHQKSWHSVSRIRAKQNRCCVSNYYFSQYPIGVQDYFQVTSFRGRPEQPMRDLVLRGDIWLRMMLRKFFPQGIKDNPHYYSKDSK